ncbi:hypothetical protein Tco_1108558 [Tanacetum coccineum]
MGSKAIEVVALKEEEFAQITVLGVHVSIPTIICVVVSSNNLPCGNLPKTKSLPKSRWRASLSQLSPHVVAKFLIPSLVHLDAVAWFCDAVSSCFMAFLQ